MTEFPVTLGFRIGERAATPSVIPRSFSDEGSLIFLQNNREVE